MRDRVGPVGVQAVARVPGRLDRRGREGRGRDDLFVRRARRFPGADETLRVVDFEVPYLKGVRSRRERDRALGEAEGVVRVVVDDELPVDEQASARVAPQLEGPCAALGDFDVGPELDGEVVGGAAGVEGAARDGPGDAGLDGGGVVGGPVNLAQLRRVRDGVGPVRAQAVPGIGHARLGGIVAERAGGDYGRGGDAGALPVEHEPL